MHKGSITLAFIAAVMLAIFTLGGESYKEKSTFEVKNNQVIFREDDKVVKTLSLKPETPYEDNRPETPNEARRGYIKDEVFYDQRVYDPEYLLIYRNGNYPDGAHVAPINGKRIEVYDRKGNQEFVINNHMGMYSGSHILFSQDWVVIISNAEGMIYGYGFIHMKDQTHKYVSFPAERGRMAIEEFIHVIKIDSRQTGYTKEKDVVWVISRIGGVEEGRKVITEITSDGSYKRSDVRFK